MPDLSEFPRDAEGRVILPESILTRFWSKVDKRGEDECWPWLGCLDAAGYGRIQISGSARFAHRISFLLCAPIPDDYFVHHICHERSCVNPNHLEPLTPLENSRRRQAGYVRPDRPSIGFYRKSDEELFWERVSKENGEDGCWLWTGARNENGYGTFSSNQHRSPRRAHRFAYELLVGPIPRGKLLCHNCPTGDNRACVNPSHIFLGTHRDNYVDMVKKGRANFAKGDKSGRRKHPESWYVDGVHKAARHTPEQIAQIFTLREQGYSSGAISRELGITPNVIGNVLYGRQWKSVPGKREIPLPQGEKARPKISFQTRGENHSGAKLTEAQVIAIRQRVANGETQKAVREEYGLPKSTVGHIIQGRTWRHLLPDDAPTYERGHKRG